MNRDTYVIMPVYNEAPVIGSVIEELSQAFENIICINDGSTDTSAVEIRKTPSVLVNHPINLGQGAALKTGIEYALQDVNAAYFVTFDSDGQHKVDDALKMLEIAREGEFDVVLGSRFLGKAENINPVRSAFLRIAVLFSNIETGIRLTDAHNGLRVFNRKFAEQLDITMPGMAHATEVIHSLAKSGLRYVEMPVTVLYTEYSRSKSQSLINSVNIGFDLLMKRMARK
ncbi:MAG TPA: glycosyltransferase family 2 protein [Gaiellaceae bacterium]